MNVSPNRGGLHSASAGVPLACAAVWAQNVPLLRTLPANASLELGQRDAQGRDALMYASSVANREIVQLLLGKGANPRASDFLGKTALHYAVLAGQLGIAADLVQAGALLDTQNHSGETPLFLATRDCHLALVQFLLERCADANVVTAPHEVSPLHMATVNANVELCRLLLRHGAAVNARDDVGETPLHWAACDYEGDISVIRLLVEEANADISVQNEDGETAIHHAAAAGMADLVSYLTERGNRVAALKSHSAPHEAGPPSFQANPFTAFVY